MRMPSARRAEGLGSSGGAVPAEEEAKLFEGLTKSGDVRRRGRWEGRLREAEGSHGHAPPPLRGEAAETGSSNHFSTSMRKSMLFVR